MVQGGLKVFYLVIGWLSLILGAIGAFLPVLPTTPFLILSAYCFSKSSERLHQWLLNQRFFGPMISDWEKYGVIRKKAKWMATVMIVVLFSYTLLFVPVAIEIKTLVSAIGVSVLIFLWTRPSEYPKASDHNSDRKPHQESDLHEGNFDK